MDYTARIQNVPKKKLESFFNSIKKVENEAIIQFKDLLEKDSTNDNFSIYTNATNQHKSLIKNESLSLTPDELSSLEIEFSEEKVNNLYSEMNEGTDVPAIFGMSNLKKASDALKNFFTGKSINIDISVVSDVHQYQYKESGKSVSKEDERMFVDRIGFWDDHVSIYLDAADVSLITFIPDEKIFTVKEMTENNVSFVMDFQKSQVDQVKHLLSFSDEDYFNLSFDINTEKVKFASPSNQWELDGGKLLQMQSESSMNLAVRSDVFAKLTSEDFIVRFSEIQNDVMMGLFTSKTATDGFSLVHMQIE